MSIFNWFKRKKVKGLPEPAADNDADQQPSLPEADVLPEEPSGSPEEEPGLSEASSTFGDTGSGWSEADSISISLSKDSLAEDMSKPAGNNQKLSDLPQSISNEEIINGDVILNTYEVISDAIKGGMGSVWKVHHNGWDTDLAMKRPQPRFFAEGSEKRKENFVHECEAWINLGLHPNIVSCYYVREISGVPTIFSEWMENGSLKNRIDDGTLYEVSDKEGKTEEEKQAVIQARLLDIAIQFARGLHYAHESEGHLIHQDVKPDNLLLTKDWQAKVADFGLARARTQMLDDSEDNAASEDSEQESVISAGATRLAPSGGYTPAYCSYEQVLGRPLSRRTDIYSWAVSVLEMYLGKRTWKSGTQVGENCGAYFVQCRTVMPESLQALLSKCLEEDPEERPHDFAEVEKALLEVYEETVGAPYQKEKSEAAADTAASLNNKALSYIDLGKYEEAEDLLKQVVSKDGSLFLYHYNLALLRWNRMEISDAAFVSYLKAHTDKSELCRERLEEIAEIRGGYDDGKEEYYYSTYKQERPEYLDPLCPVSALNYDGTLQVEGYIEKDQYRQEHYGYRVKDLSGGEVRDFPNNYDDYGVTTPRDGLTYLHAHYYKDDKVFFAGPRSEFIIMAADVLWIFDAKSGRLILSLPPVVDEDGDTFPYEVLGFTESGIIEYKNWEQRWGRWDVHALRLHPEIMLPYEIAGIATVDARLEAERSVEKNYREAEACWEKGNIQGTYRALNKSLEDQVLTMHEPSLRLWSKLGEYYSRGSLVTVVPTSDDPTMPPQRYECLEDQPHVMSAENMNRTDNGQTEVILDRIDEEEFDEYNDAYEYTFYFSLTAVDKFSGITYFTVKNLEVACEADWKRFSKDRYLVLEGDTKLWYAQEYAEEEIIDLAPLSTETGKFKDGKSRLSFMLPRGYELKNTKDGVDIGGFVFNDVFTDFRPLWNADVIACRDHNYRLVYNYIL